MQHARPNRLRRAVAYAVLAAVLGLVSLTLSQCTLVGDSTTGVELNRNGPTSCIKDCNNAAQAGNAQCAKDHETAREQCKATYPPGPDQGACLEAADAAHAACNAANNAAKVECQNNCHRQGAGSAG